MKKIFTREIVLLLFLFICSRIIIRLAGVGMDYSVLYKYWQYLDVDTLQHNLLAGVWYDHTQPPVFNLFLGVVLKLAGGNAENVFTFLLYLITLLNGLLLLSLLKQVSKHRRIPLIITIVYLLSPGTIIFENELFYTTFISLLLLTSCYFLLRLQKKINLFHTAGFFIPLVIACLTRSMYHLFWIAALAAIVIYSVRRRPGLRTVVAFSVLSILVVTGWYVKNYSLFQSFSSSTWLGMNVARNVFHDVLITDSSKIESIEPFSQISVYDRFLDPGVRQKYKGLNDRDLLMEMKNDSFINEKHIDYLQVSKKYMDASKQEVKTHPVSYLKNVLQSSISFFAPATRYPSSVELSKKLGYYDAVYSFNLSQFAEGKQQRRIALVLSAIPKILFYLFVLFILLREWRRQKTIPLLYLFILAILFYIFSVSSLLEHYENMRFRFEIEPLFLVLAGAAISRFLRLRRSGGKLGD